MNMMKTSQGFACAGLVAMLLGFASPATSAPLTFFGEDLAAAGSLPVPNSVAAQAAFLSNLIGVGVEDFEGFAVGTNFNFDVAFGADTATLSGTNTVATTGIQNAGLAGRFATSGSQYLNVGTGDALSFSLTFSNAQAAFGFFGTDIGDFLGQLTLSFDGGAPVLVPHTVGAPGGSGLFFGYIDVANPFTLVQFANTQGAADAFGFDQFTIGRIEQVVPTVPEPSTLLLLGTGLAAAVVRRRMTKQA